MFSWAKSEYTACIYTIIVTSFADRVMHIIRCSYLLIPLPWWGPCPIVHRTRKTRFFLYIQYYRHYYLPTTPSPINCDCTYTQSAVCVCGMRNLVEHVIYIFGTQFDSARLITGRRGGLIQYVPT